MTVPQTTERESIQAFEHMLDVEVADFQQRYQRYLLVLLTVLAWVAALRYTITSNWPEISKPNLPPLVSLLLALALGYLLRRRTVLSITLSLIGLVVTVTLEVLGHPGSPAILLYAPFIMLASAVASTATLVFGGLACGVIVMLLTWGMSNSPELFIAPGLLLFSAMVCAWIASRPIFDSLSMALNSAQDSIRARDELREQRRQLAQSVKALDEALYRLGRLNTSLIIARQQAEEARQLKVRFANMISHEIRTPLNIIISFSEVIANAPESYGMAEWPPSLRDDVKEIYSSGKHLLGLINDVLDLAQIEANRVVLKREKASVLDVVDQAVALAGKWFDHAGLYLRTEVVGEIPEVILDRIRIRQVILNLLSNARHYTAAGGVTVRIERLNDEIVVSVRDTGVGISAASLQHLFDEFQQSGESVDKSSGSGLGLSISRMFIDLHGGRMWAESAGIPGSGTTLSFSLPLPSTNIATELPPTQRDVEFWQSRYDQARSERLILVACDDPTLSQMTSRLLNNQGKVVTSSHRELQQTLVEREPDVVLSFTDNAGSGPALDIPIEPITTDVPIITCRLERNAEAERENAPNMLDANSWLLKPVTRDDLVTAILAVAPRARVVLSVEDDLTMAHFYELSMASDKRFATMPTVINVTRVADVIPALEEHVPDVVLLDLNLADGSGWDVLANLRARWSREQLPVIIVTAMDRYGLPVLRAHEISVRRAQGFSQRQTVMCLQNTLDAMLS
ncbi:MAG: ATP-binding protein [Chloroflexi bacterium]|nr:ATP-binding protein [Chloroflexota bacterium]MCL5275786.1 ATP-binding protein [Chloroflexota bacterium]